MEASNKCKKWTRKRKPKKKENVKQTIVAWETEVTQESAKWNEHANALEDAATQGTTLDAVDADIDRCVSISEDNPQPK